MKKLLIAFAFVFVCAQGFAQFYVGGSFGFTSSTVSGAEGMDLGLDDFEDLEDLDYEASDDMSGSSFKFLPEIGYQLLPNAAIGVSFGYIKGYAAFGSIDIADYKALLSTIISTAADISSDDGGGYSSIRLAPYIRYTLIKEGGFEIFADGIIGVNSITDKSSDSKITSMEICVRPGISFAISSRVKLLAKMGSVGIQNLKMKDSDFKVTRFGLDLDGNNMLLGAAFYF